MSPAWPSGFDIHTQRHAVRFSPWLRQPWRRIRKRLADASSLRWPSPSAAPCCSKPRRNNAVSRVRRGNRFTNPKQWAGQIHVPPIFAAQIVFSPHSFVDRTVISFYNIAIRAMTGQIPSNPPGQESAFKAGKRAPDGRKRHPRASRATGRGPALEG